jgi:phage terminase Nu1 subunit (DNA packaging protein)
LTFQRAALVRLQRELVLLKLRVAKGELVEAAAVERDEFTIARTVRDAILGVPDRVAAAIAAATKTDEVHQILSEELRSALGALADRFEEQAS